MRVIGTAGHVDHGKSTLVKRLTGIDPDRLREEKARQLTIDLGFAWFSLDGETVGVVDVPGHRDFIENMLAGVAGLDAAILIIAADEGVMPQTREHLAILDLLGIPTGIIVLSKIDLIEDPEWLDLVEIDVRDVVQGTTLEDAPIVRLSAHTGEGIEVLTQQLSQSLAHSPPRVNYNQPRLPVDRVFTVEGFGTVVTGTLSGGTLTVGDIIEVQPGGLQGRVRGLQSYKQSVDVVLPGSRAAINIAGVDKDQIVRGDVIAYSGQLQASHLIDVQFRYLPDVERPLKHNAEVKFFSGASESLAYVRLLNANSITPGTTAWLQLRLESPIPLTMRDRFILRYPSPPQTIGGGLIVNPHPTSRWKRFDERVIADLEMRLSGTPSERVTQAAHGNAPTNRVHIQQKTGLNDDDLDAAIADAIQQGRLIAFAANGTYWAVVSVEQYIGRITKIVGAYHARFPLRAGISREELRSQLGLKQRVMNQLLDQLPPALCQTGDIVQFSDHQIVFSDKQQAAVDQLMAAFQATPYTPPSYKDAVEIVGEDVLRALIELGKLVQIQANVIFTRDVYDQMVASVSELLDAHGAIDAKQVRDHFNTSRKYAIGLLEHLDQIGYTKREGDLRVRGKI